MSRRGKCLHLSKWTESGSCGAILIDTTLTWLANLSLWEGHGGWQAVIRTTLHCARQSLCHERSLAQLPFRCAEAAGCPAERVVPVAASWLLLYVAARLFDLVEDRDFEPGDWDGMSEAEAINVASAFLAAIPLVLAELEDAQLGADLTLDFQRVALTMAAGQHADLSGWIESGEGAVERYWQVATAKSGDLFALACRAGARCGNQPTGVLTAYADFGRLLGQLVQVCDDYRDTYEPGSSSDFQAGRTSLPVIYGRTVAEHQEREQIEALRAQAATDSRAASQLRQLLDDLGARHYMLLQIELLGQQAEDALRRAAVIGPDLERLLELIPRTAELCLNS